MYKRQIQNKPSTTGSFDTSGTRQRQLDRARQGCKAREFSGNPTHAKIKDLYCNGSASTATWVQDKLHKEKIIAKGETGRWVWPDEAAA